MKSGTSLLLDDDCDAKLDSLLSERRFINTYHACREVLLKLPRNMENWRCSWFLL